MASRKLVFPLPALFVCFQSSFFFQTAFLSCFLFACTCRFRFVNENLVQMLVVLPSVQSAYQILSQMSTIIYLTMVFIVYFAFIRLRRTEPNMKHGFRVPGGEFGKWLVTGIGILGALVAMVLSFVPPSQINTGSPLTYVVILILGSAFFIAVPFVVYAKRKPNWRDKGTEVLS